MELFSHKKIEDIKDIDELFVALTKRKHWKHIPDVILRQIFDNAQGDIEKVQKFRSVSELHHCVDNNFVPLLQRNSNPRMVLALFSVTLERLAAQTAQSVLELPDGSREQTMAIETTKIAYMSSILCNPIMLPSYGGLAWFYMILGSTDRAVEACRSYDAAEQKLLSSDDRDLGYYDQAMKSYTSKMRKIVDQVKTELGIE